MKKNITIVCLDDSLRKNVAKEFAKTTNMLYLDVDELLDFELLDRKLVAIKCGDEYLKEAEKKCLQRVAEYENCVFAISCDIFLANNNRELLNDTKIVYLESLLENVNLSSVKSRSEREKLVQNLEISHYLNEFLKNTTKICIENADKMSMNDILTAIKEKLDN